MSIFHYTNAFFQIVPYSYLPHFWQVKIRRHRLNSLLRYAKKHSDYYRQCIPDDLALAEIPPIDKPTFLKHFDEIVTDKRVTLDRVLAAIKSGDEKAGCCLDGKYTVAMTSGSTGDPTIVLQDGFFQKATALISGFRVYKNKLPVIMVTEAGGFGIEASLIRQNTKQVSFAKSLVHMVDIENTPIDEMIRQLQEIGPGVLSGYTGVMTILANKLIDRGVRIKEKMVLLSGEKTCDFDKEVVRRAFDCKTVKVIYGCTEGGTVAHECPYGHLHIMHDCAVLEPVDQNNQPVGYDVLSDKVLLTNLLNRVQPVIRYEVTDRIILHKGCPCGCKDDWLEIEGRTNDKIVIEQNGQTTEIPSMSMLIAMAGINKNGLEKFKNYQVAITKSGHFAVTLDYAADADREAVNREIEAKLRSFFAMFGIRDITCSFEAGSLKKTTRGKYKRIYMTD